MKKLSYAFIVLGLLLILAFIPADPSIAGKWIIHTHDNSDVTATFNNDGSYTAVDPAGDHPISGKYMVTKDTLAMSDEGCGSDVWGKYKLTFYGTDSLDLKVISDDCDGRKQSVDGVNGKRLAGN